MHKPTSTLKRRAAKEGQAIDQLRPEKGAPHNHIVRITTVRYDVEDNEILGSGNFDIVKGGTFYQNDDFQYRFNRCQRFSHP